MVKAIIKEIFIILLLMVAILLVLGIMFYDYRPTTKKVPSKVAEYTLPEKMVEELEETIEASKTQNIVRTYRVDSHDLAVYENSKDYNKGKINPFGKITTSGGTGGNTTGGNSTTGNTTGNTSSSGSGSTGSFLNDIK